MRLRRVAGGSDMMIEEEGRGEGGGRTGAGRQWTELCGN